MTPECVEIVWFAVVCFLSILLGGGIAVFVVAKVVVPQAYAAGRRDAVDQILADAEAERQAQAYR